MQPPHTCAREFRFRVRPTHTGAGVFRVRKKMPPWKGRFLSVTRLSDWLRLLDLQIVLTERSVHFLPFNTGRILNFADTFEKYGKKTEKNVPIAEISTVGH